jgi:hypothetical protein
VTWVAIKYDNPNTDTDIRTTAKDTLACSPLGQSMLLKEVAQDAG